MSMTNQKLIQNYLDKHDIGQLFEDMMAKVIKDMPNDPISYLLRLLQKLQHRRNENAQRHRYSENLDNPPNDISSKQMGLVGSSVPKKWSKDPQVILPGSKPVTSSWASSSGVESTPETDVRLNKHSREYEKPWLSGAKIAKGKVQRGQAHKTWTADAEPMTKSYNDGNMASTDKRKNKLLQSAPSGLQEFISPSHKERVSPRKQDNGWKESQEKGSEQPRTLQHIRQKIDNDELELSRRQVDEVHDGSKAHTLINRNAKTFSPASYAKFKKQNSRRKSQQQKTKLQALLSNDSSSTAKKASSVKSESDDDEGIEKAAQIYQRKELQSKLPKGSNARNHPQMCQPMSKYLSAPVAQTDVLFKPRRKNQFSSIQSDDDDFESVSQINSNVPYKPKWPTLQGSELSEDAEDNNAEIITKTKSPKKVTMKTQVDSHETDKSDFFKTNSPLRKKKNKSFNILTESENESIVSASSKLVTSKPPPSRTAWKQRVSDTASEADNDDFLGSVTSTKRGGWKQKSDDEEVSD